MVLGLMVWGSALALVATVSLGWRLTRLRPEGLWVLEWLSGALAYAVGLLALLPTMAYFLRHAPGWGGAGLGLGLLVWLGLGGAALVTLLAGAPGAKRLGLCAALAGPVCWLGLQDEGTLLMLPYALVSVGLMGLVTLRVEEEVPVTAGAPRSIASRRGRLAAPRTRAAAPRAGSAPRR